MAESTSELNNVDSVSMGAFPWWSVLLWGICAFIIGIMLLSTPIATTLVLITFLGAWWFVGGVFSLISLAADRSNMAIKIVTGLLSLFVGLVVLTYPIYSTLIILPFFVIIIGIWGIIIGGAHLFQGYSTKDWGSAAMGLLSVVFGLLLLVYPIEAAITLPVVIGILAIIGGISAIIGSINLKSMQAGQAAK
ncbi:MAG: hypothetical protein CVV33_02000 [Methanomicrobiales archaeon HGW-Methanomicrobiales-4]|nr:MAG: hypothetical protein CVV33_02000 [Methanomicrobiales archaeon HGW-Methanomicrobiales-4]